MIKIICDFNCWRKLINLDLNRFVKNPFTMLRFVKNDLRNVLLGMLPVEQHHNLPTKVMTDRHTGYWGPGAGEVQLNDLFKTALDEAGFVHFHGECFFKPNKFQKFEISLYTIHRIEIRSWMKNVDCFFIFQKDHPARPLCRSSTPWDRHRYQAKKCFLKNNPETNKLIVKQFNYGLIIFLNYYSTILFTWKNRWRSNQEEIATHQHQHRRGPDRCRMVLHRTTKHRICQREL